MDGNGLLSGLKIEQCIFIRIKFDMVRKECLVMFKIIKIDLIKYFIVCGILLAITGVWQILELIEFGKVMPSISDTIVSIAFTFSLYKNLNIKIEND